MGLHYEVDVILKNEAAVALGPTRCGVFGGVKPVIPRIKPVQLRRFGTRRKAREPAYSATRHLEARSGRVVEPVCSFE